MNSIEVILNDRRSFTAKVIGTDPSTDLALLKIDAKNLPYLTYGNSDAIKTGSVGSGSWKPIQSDLHCNSRYYFSQEQEY